MNNLSNVVGRTLRVALPAALAICLAPAAGAQMYTFDRDAQGWQIFHVGMSGHVPSPSPLQAAPWVETGGNPAGCLRVGDLTSETCIGMPSEQLGSRPTLYGQAIGYDALYRGADNANYSAVVIAGQAITLYYPHAKPTLNVYGHFEIPLTETGWRVNGDGGVAATEAQFRGVLDNIQGIYIRTEWATGPDDTSIDNIRVGSSCVADLTGDQIVDLADFFQFFGCFDASDPCADIDGNPGVDLGDFFEFFNHFDVRC